MMWMIGSVRHEKRGGARVVAGDIVGLLGDWREVGELAAHRVDLLERLVRLGELALLPLLPLFLLQLRTHYCSGKLLKTS